MVQGTCGEGSKPFCWCRMFIQVLFPTTENLVSFPLSIVLAGSCSGSQLVTVQCHRPTALYIHVHALVSAVHCLYTST